MNAEPNEGPTPVPLHPYWDPPPGGGFQPLWGKPRLIAEVCSNHNRDLARCEQLIESAAELGCSGVKFQQFRVRELFSPEALKHAPRLREREEWELPEEYNRELAAHAHEHGITFASTPFYLRAVEVLEPWVDFFKVASYQILWEDLLREVAGTGKPVVLATGMANLDEVRAAVSVLRESGCEDLMLLHCVSSYPADPAEAFLKVIPLLRSEFGLPVGWSDHTREIGVVLQAIHRFDANMIEFHFDLDGRGAESEMGHCWLPRDVWYLLQELRFDLHNYEADGFAIKEPRPSEAIERTWRTDPRDGLRPLLATREALGLEDRD